MTLTCWGLRCNRCCIPFCQCYSHVSTLCNLELYCLELSLNGVTWYVRIHIVDLNLLEIVCFMCISNCMYIYSFIVKVLVILVLFFKFVIMLDCDER